MYPDRELIRLAARKAELRREITVSREHCRETAIRATQPLVWLDRVIAVVRQLSPMAMLAAVPAGIVLQRTVFPRFKLLGTLLRWGPPVFAAVRGLRVNPAASSFPKSKSI